MNDNSVKKDIGVAAIAVVAFYLILLVANWVDARFGLSEVYNLVDIASVTLKVATASAIAWILKRVVFAKTLGKDFGDTFNKGWDAMTTQEKARWTIGTFLVIFVSVILASK